VTEYSAVDIQGFLPAVEPTRTEKLLLLNGQNYIFDARGPKSPFGNRLLLPFALGRPEYTQGIRLKLFTGDRCFTITSDAILEWDEVAGGWRIVYIFGRHSRQSLSLDSRLPQRRHVLSATRR
jgi:hypothetical protein